MYIGLDTATVMGIAVVRGNEIGVMEVKGTPVVQWQTLRSLLMVSTPAALVFEKQHNFLNATTTRNLLERYGYLKHSLLALAYRVEEVSPRVARHFLEVKGKEEVRRKLLHYYRGSRKFTDNHADALAVALYQAHKDGVTIEWSSLCIENLLETGVVSVWR